MSTVARLADIVAVLEECYDPAGAETWDAVGLVVGDPADEVRRVLLAVDPVQAVLDEAVSFDADLLVTHHPLLLRPVHSVSVDRPKGRAVTTLIRGGISLYVAHTNADVANPGVSDALAAAVGLTSTVPIAPETATALDKIVTFVPVPDAQRVIDALAAAGAGRLGNYERAAWTTEGTGTFRPLPGANPAIGDIGAAEEVPETRVEMMLPPHRRHAVVAALRTAHPYEEPAFDITQTVPLAPDRGLGRVGELPEAETLRQFASRVAAVLPVTAAGVRFSGDPDRPVRRVAVCGGAGDGLFDQVRATGADVYVTADLRHHPASEAGEHGGLALVDCSHWATEWPWLLDARRALEEGLGRKGTTVDARVSHLVTDPWTGTATHERPDGTPSKISGA